MLLSNISNKKVSAGLRAKLLDVLALSLSMQLLIDCYLLASPHSLLVLSPSHPACALAAPSHLGRYPFSLSPSLSLSLVWIDYKIEYLLVGLSTRVFSLISCLNASRLATGRESFVAFVRHGKLGKLQEQGCAWCVTLLDFHVRTAFLGLCNALKGCEATPNSCVSFDSP